MERRVEMSKCQEELNAYEGNVTRGKGAWRKGGGV
jgi:hypothetical protein